jgi:hypothetical protein
MTIRSKALEEQFLMVPLFFSIQPFSVENSFSEFFSKNLSFKESRSVGHATIQM